MKRTIKLLGHCSPWNAQTDSDLTRYWLEGLSTLEIGRRIGVSKYAVVGRAYRLHLPRRPSPIKGVIIRHNASTIAARILEQKTAAPKVAPKPTTGEVPACAPVVPKAVGTCRFPTWRDGAPVTHQYCDAPAVIGRSWCLEHMSQVFVRQVFAR